MRRVKNCVYAKKGAKRDVQSGPRVPQNTVSNGKISRDNGREVNAVEARIAVDTDAVGSIVVEREIMNHKFNS